MWHSTMSYSYSTRQRFRFCPSVNEKWKWNSWYERIFRSFSFYSFVCDSMRSIVMMRSSDEWIPSSLTLKIHARKFNWRSKSDVIVSSQLFSFKFQILNCLTKWKILSRFIVFYCTRFDNKMCRHEYSKKKLIVGWSFAAKIYNLCFCLCF